MRCSMAAMSGRMHGRSQERILLLYLVMVLAETPFKVVWLAKALAEKGYVVLATNHPGTTSRDSLPERTVMIGRGQRT
jgi:alpha-beta hydrolase superfamily lysophospholipase